MGGACGTDGRDVKYTQYFGRKIWREETTRKTGVDEEILEWILDK